jgi:PKD repeat protein
MSCPSRCRAVALALLGSVVLAAPAQAATQTVNDPADAYVNGFDISTDVRAVTLDSTRTPGKVMFDFELEFAASAALQMAILLDTNADGKADHAVDVSAAASKHPDLDGTNGGVRYLLRPVTTSTTACQSYDDGTPPIENPFVDYVAAPASLRTADLRTTFTIPVDLAAIGNPATFRWAVAAASSFGPVFYDFVPDAANGLPGRDPHNGSSGEQDDWFCSPAGDGLSAGYHVDMTKGATFPDGGGGGPVDQAPTVEIAQSPALARPGQPVTLTANATDSDGTIASYSWDLDANAVFGDATGAEVQRTFATPGSYLVRVRVTDNGGNIATAERTIEVAARPLTLTLATSIASPLVRQQVTLSATVASDSPVDPASIEWGIDIDNNGDDAEPYTGNTGPTWTLGFGAPRLWTIKARVRNAAGEVATARIQIVVPNQPPVFRFFRIRAKKVPDEPFNTDPLVKGNPIVLEASFTDDNLTRPRVEWDLNGDGDYNEAVGERIEYTFPTAGEKKIAVRIVDEGGLVLLANTSIEIRETAESGCTGKAGDEGIRAIGCFKSDPVTPTTKTSKEPVSINGLTFVPQDGATINVAIGGLVFVTGFGTVKVFAGSIELFEGRVKIDANCDRTKTACPIGTFKVPALSKMKGFPLQGDVEVFLTPEGTLTKVNVDVLGSIGLGITAKADVLTTDTGGLVLNSLDLRSPMIPLGKLSIGQFRVQYDGKTRRWEGSGNITLPTPQFTRLIGDFAFSELTGFERAHGEVDGLNLPLDEGTVYLQRVAFTIEAKGFEAGGSPRIRLGGGIGISAGPRVAGVDIATVDGDFLVTFGDPFGFDIEGRISVAGFDVMGGEVGVRTNGDATFKGFIGFGLPFPSAYKGKRQDATKLKVSRFTSNGADVFNPLLQIVSIKGEASGWAEPDAFSLEAGVSLKVIGITIASAEGLFSSKAIAGCGQILHLRGGFGYTYAHYDPKLPGPKDEPNVPEKLDVLGKSCDLGDYEPLRTFKPLDSNGAGRLPPEARSARASTRQANATATPDATAIDVAAGQKALVLRLDGAGGDPVVTLIAPDGTSYAMPATDPVVQTDAFFAARHPLENATYLGVSAPAAGRWTIQPQPGSAAITAVSGARVLPQPSVKATVRGTRRTRTIDYEVKPIPGQAVTFVEEGSDTHRTVGTAKGRRGSLTFVPQDGTGRARTLVAIVTQGGLDRVHLKVARFTAPALRRAARPTGLRARRGTGGSVAVSWKRVAGIARYELVARIDDGRTLGFSTRAAHVKVPGVGRQHAVRFDVRAFDPPARDSHRSTVRLAAALGATILRDPSGRTTSSPVRDSLLLRCSGAAAAGQDVYRDGSRVRVVGAATRRSAGKSVAIRLLATGKIAGRARVLGDGSFTTSVALPAPGLRRSERARYRAEIAGSKSSPAVKLARRVMFRSMRRTATTTTIKGHVVRPLARPAHGVVLLRQTRCGAAQVVGRATPDRNGDVLFTVKTPKGVSGVAYRLRSSVRRPGGGKEFTAYSVARDMTLP